METDHKIGPSCARTLKMSRMQLLKCVTGATAASQICTRFNVEGALSDLADYAVGSVKIASGQFVLDAHVVANFRTTTISNRTHYT